MCQPGGVLVVVAAEDEVAGVCARLDGAEVGAVRVVAPSAARRLLLVTVDDAWAAERIAADLRAEGRIAVVRPEGGPRLEEWMRHTRPITIGDRIGVCFAWSEHDRAGLPPVVELGTGGFGSGRHPTTRLLVEELAERISGGERVLDVGCGSGVLGLCALALGAAQVVAIDVKPEAVEATRRNAALNGMEGRMTAVFAPLAEIDGTFDVVLANIGRSAIVELAPDLVERVASDGWLAVSGINTTQADQVAAFLTPLQIESHRRSEEWSALVLRHADRADVPRA